MNIDESILKAEYQLYTSQAISFDQYKEIRKRQDNSFGMVHVFGGFVNSVKESFSGGFWDLSVSVTDNMAWLEWSQFAISPSLSDPKNILEDPLTPYSMVKDELGQIVPSERDLLHENKQLLQSGPPLSFGSSPCPGNHCPLLSDWVHLSGRMQPDFVSTNIWVMYSSCEASVSRTDIPSTVCLMSNLLVVPLVRSKRANLLIQFCESILAEWLRHFHVKKNHPWLIGGAYPLHTLRFKVLFPKRP